MILFFLWTTIAVKPEQRRRGTLATPCTTIKQNKKYDWVFSEVVREFPFEGYLDSNCYHELKAILGGLELFLPEFDDLKLLDVGSGPMDKTAVLQKIGFECSAVDDLGDPWHKLDGKTEAIVNFGRRMGIDFYSQNDEDFTIPFEFNYFDVVTSIAVIEHLHETPRLILNSMGNHLKRGNIITPSQTCWEVLKIR